MRLISMLWVTMLSAVLSILSMMKILDINHSILFWIHNVMFICTFILVWISLESFQSMIKRGIQEWDDEMRANLEQFYRIRSSRILTSILSTGAVFILQAVLHFMSTRSVEYEVVSYLYLVVLFHVTLMCTLILAKLQKTVLWIEHENQMEKLEQP
jgi:hypothetical protein